jgi:hypothetical protein
MAGLVYETTYKQVQGKKLYANAYVHSKAEHVYWQGVNLLAGANLSNYNANSGVFGKYMEELRNNIGLSITDAKGMNVVEQMDDETLAAFMEKLVEQINETTDS